MNSVFILWVNTNYPAFMLHQIVFLSGCVPDSPGSPAYSPENNSVSLSFLLREYVPGYIFAYLPVDRVQRSGLFVFTGSFQKRYAMMNGASRKISALE